MAVDKDKQGQNIGGGKPLSGRKPDRIIRNEPNKKEQKRESELGTVTIIRGDTLVARPGETSGVFDDMYRALYLLGLLVLRRLRHGKRRIQLRISKIRGWIAATIYRIQTFLVRGYRGLIRRIRRPFEQMQYAWEREEGAVAASRAVGKVPLRSYVRVTMRSFGYVWRVVATALNYLAPVAAVVVLVVILGRQLAVPKGLLVSYKGEQLGYIQNEKDFNDALRDVDKRMASNVETNFTSGAPLFQVVALPPQVISACIGARWVAMRGLDNIRPAEDQALGQLTTDPAKLYQSFFTPKKDLANGIIRASSDEIVYAYGLYANQELVGAVLNGDVVIEEIERIQRENTTGKPKERVEFSKAISYTDGLFPLESVIPEEELIAALHAKESTDEMYTVIAGDTPSAIAQKKGISRTMLYELNPNLEEDFKEGQELYISKAQPFLSIRNIYTDVYDDPIPYRVVERENVLYAVGYYQVDRPGVPGMGRITAEITAVDGVEISRLILDVQHISDPKEELVTIGATQRNTSPNVVAPPSQSGFMWPGQGGFIGTGLGGYYGHSGVDINDSGGVGAPVYASASGTVTTAVRSFVGYGHYIEINHGDGFTTLYAHNTDLYASMGDYVSKGQIIASVGSTGNSTGAHIHFEIKFGGQVMNPANYIGTAG